MSPTPRQILERARTLIAAPESWCKGPREVKEGKVVARCAIVAWSDTVNSYGIPRRGDELHTAQEASWRALRRVSERPVAQYNDAGSTTHADILALYDRAIAVFPEEPDNGYTLARFT